MCHLAQATLDALRPIFEDRIISRKANDAPKTNNCLVRILVQRHNWAIFLKKWARKNH